jgi:anti-sigma regulatory factor (Ser/Thr protein kinase)
MLLVPAATTGAEPGGAGFAQAPTFVCDARAGAVLSANRAGWQFWGGDGSSPDPVAIDRAMPALDRLRALAEAGLSARDLELNLTFWTARGIAQRNCFVSGPETGARFVVRLSGLPAAADLTPHPSEGVEQAKLAHEIRTPLSAVISYAEVLKDEHFGPLGNPCYRSYASNIFESARHVLRLVDGMLQGFLDRSSASRLTFTNVAADEVIESCLILARPVAERAGVDLIASLPSDPPHVVADELSLKQILLNLLANAIKFSRRGDRVSVTAATPAIGKFEISVCDTGPGMAEPQVHFEPWCQRSARAGTANAGLGFGLPLAKALAEANGASLHINSELGRGTCVTLTFAKDRVVPV